MTRRTAEDWDRWLAEVSRGENPEAWRGIVCFLRWLQIRADQGHPAPNFLTALEGDILHSHLLRRMLAGNQPLDAPPPESFGEPWYEVVETGRGVATEVKPWEWAPDQKISVNQGIWTILEKRSDVDYLVTYRQNPAAYRLSRQADGTWLLERADRAPV